ncbi:MAG: hypothetical protein AAB339_04955, partial [Elusimicrobiota bacterium]
MSISSSAASAGAESPELAGLSPAPAGTLACGGTASPAAAAEPRSFSISSNSLAKSSLILASAP